MVQFSVTSCKCNSFQTQKTIPSLHPSPPVFFCWWFPFSTSPLAFPSLLNLASNFWRSVSAAFSLLQTGFLCTFWLLFIEALGSVSISVAAERERVVCQNLISSLAVIASTANRMSHLKRITSISFSKKNLCLCEYLGN